MAHIKDKVQDSLDECRMLILGGQVLISFSAESVLEPGFLELPEIDRALCLVGMLCLVIAVGIFMSPAAYHRIACAGEDRQSLLRFTTRMSCIALVPFATGLSAAVYVAADRSAGPRWALLIGFGLFCCAGLAWYVFPSQRRVKKEASMERIDAENDLKTKIRHVLTEARMVLPGAQALLGFGGIAVLMDSFKHLPEKLKLVHLCGLVAIAIAVVLLMTPAAYHRIAEDGEHTERFHRIATRFLLAAMASLALGMAAAVWLVVEIATASSTAGIFGGLAVISVFYTLWFIWPMLCRHR
jgi:hypothetical protein